MSNMNTKPRIKINLSNADKIFEYLGWIVLLLYWLFLITNYQNTSETIPTHFNVFSEADRYGDKLSIFILPAIASILFIGLTILNQYPHIFNYPAKITSENAEKNYTTATRLIRYLKFIIPVLFFFISYTIVQTENSALGIWFLPIFILLIIIPTGYYIFRLTTKNN